MQEEYQHALDTGKQQRQRISRAERGLDTNTKHPVDRILFRRVQGTIPSCVCPSRLLFPQGCLLSRSQFRAGRGKSGGERQYAASSFPRFWLRPCRRFTSTSYYTVRSEKRQKNPPQDVCIARHLSSRPVRTEEGRRVGVFISRFDGGFVRSKNRVVCR